MKIFNYIKDNSYLIKTFVRVTVLYTNKGNIDEKFSFILFKKRVLPKIIESLVIALIYTSIAVCSNSSMDSEKILSLGISFYASILGFGITSYTIMLMFADEILHFLKNAPKEKGLNPQIFNSDMSFPLIMIGFIIFIQFFISSFKSNTITLYIGAFLFTYGLLLVLEIIRVIYLSMGLVIKKKLEKIESSTPDETKD